MSGTIGQMLLNQYEAAFRTLGLCVDRCPEPAWNEPVANLAFCQVAFHTLFFADYYLGENEDALRQQAFHRENQRVFRDYEELQPRQQELLYERPDVNAYLAHCRGKASRVMTAATLESLEAPCGFQRRAYSRAELHVYNIRHIQHHAAQLSLRLRLDFGEDIPWVKSGWE